jgi:hypothetical protein
MSPLPHEISLCISRNRVANLGYGFFTLTRHGKLLSEVATPTTVVGVRRETHQHILVKTLYVQILSSFLFVLKYNKVYPLYHVTHL